MTSHGFVGGKRTSDPTLIAGEITNRARQEGVKGVEVFFLSVPLKLPGAQKGIDVLVKFDCHDPTGEANHNRVRAFRNSLNDVPDMEGWTGVAIIGEAHTFTIS